MKSYQYYLASLTAAVAMVQLPHSTAGLTLKTKAAGVPDPVKLADITPWLCGDNTGTGAVSCLNCWWYRP